MQSLVGFVAALQLVSAFEAISDPAALPTDVSAPAPVAGQFFRSSGGPGDGPPWPGGGDPHWPNWPHWPPWVALEGSSTESAVTEAAVTDVAYTGTAPIDLTTTISTTISSTVTESLPFESSSTETTITTTLTTRSTITLTRTVSSTATSTVDPLAFKDIAVQADCLGGRPTRFFSNELNYNGQFALTNDLTKMLRLSYRLAPGFNGTQLNLTLQEPANFTQFSHLAALANPVGSIQQNSSYFAFIGTSANATAPGAPAHRRASPDPPDNSIDFARTAGGDRDRYLAIETAIWSLNTTTFELTAHWVSDNGTVWPLYALEYHSWSAAPDGMILTGDVNMTAAFFGNTTAECKLTLLQIIDGE